MTEQQTIEILRQTLSDGSHVYDVVLPDTAINAVDERAARMIAERICDLSVNNFNIIETNI